MTYLEFIDVEDYIRHLQENTFTPRLTTRAEITSKHGVCIVTFNAVLTRQFENHIAVCAIPLLQTTNLRLQTEMDALRAKVHESFDKVCAMLKERGLTVERGKWTIEPPAYLR
jgi:monoamine oxidase